MNQRVLGIIALACAPFLFIDFLINGLNQNNSWTIAVFDMVYLTGWMCSIIGLYQIKAAGAGIVAKLILWMQMLLLSVAQLSSFLAILNIQTAHAWSNISDLFWPVCNLFMLVTGAAIIKAKVLVGWKKYVPLFMGLWLPVTGVAMNIYNPDIILYIFSGPYSAVCWAACSYIVLSSYTTVAIAPTSRIRTALKLKPVSI